MTHERFYCNSRDCISVAMYNARPEDFEEYLEVVLASRLVASERLVAQLEDAASWREAHYKAQESQSTALMTKLHAAEERIKELEARRNDWELYAGIKNENAALIRKIAELEAVVVRQMDGRGTKA